MVWEKEKRADEAIHRITNQQQSSPETPAIDESTPTATLPASESEMVWYDIPELGVRFKATKDTKTDLGYVFYDDFTIVDSSMHYKSAVFFSRSQTNEEFDGCHLSEDGFTCGRFYVYVYGSNEGDIWKVKYGKDFCEGANGVLVYKNKGKSVCLFGSKVLSDNEYRGFSNIHTSMLEKKYGLSFNDTDMILP